MSEPSQTPPYHNSTPAEIRRKVAAHRVYRTAARRRRRGYLRAALLLAVLSLAVPPLTRHRHALAHGGRSWLAHAVGMHHRRTARRS